MGAASAGGDYIDGSYGQLPEGHDENSDSADSEPENHIEQAPHLDEDDGVGHGHHLHHHHHVANSYAFDLGGDNINNNDGGDVIGYSAADGYEYVSGVGNQVLLAQTEMDVGGVHNETADEGDEDDEDDERDDRHH